MHRAVIGVAAAVLGLFVILNLAFVAKRGVCCADDAWVAVVAKNLAWGFGYSTSLGFERPDFVLTRFDVYITTGPPVVLPVSAAIRILGNRSWVPGTVAVALWTVLLIAVWSALGSMATRSRATIACAAFVLVAYAVSPYHIEQWHAMLGEVPAAMAILLAFAIWAVHPRPGSRLFTAAVLCSLAVLTKWLAALYAATFVMAVVVELSGARDAKRRSQVVAAVSGFLLPILAFEAWRFASIGPGAYWSQLRTAGAFVLGYGTSRAPFSSAEITSRLIAFSERFGVSLPGLLVLALLGGSLVWKTASPAFKRLYLVLMAGVTLHACYWLLLSLGWLRHSFIGVVLLSALVTIPYLVLERGAPAMLYSGALALSLLGTVGRLQYPISALQAASTIRSSQASVVRFLDAHVHRRPFVGQAWASVVDLEYLSKSVLNFKGYAAMAPDDLLRGVLVVTNGQFDDTRDKRFTSLVASCGPPVLDAPPYAIYDCGGPKATSEVRQRP